jgi:hypothetical protein
MHLDIMEGKERQAAKELANLNLEGTAITSRLMKPCFASGRAVHAVSAFLSVYTPLRCRARGLHFMGLVKTAHKEFPLAYLKMKAINYGRGAVKPRGGHILLKLEVLHHAAHNWNHMGVHIRKIFMIMSQGRSWALCDVFRTEHRGRGFDPRQTAKQKHHTTGVFHHMPRHNCRIK